MPDLVTEVMLPSRGKVYSQEIVWENQLRAPKLKDRGFGDSASALKIQASVLDKTLVTPLGMSTYDLHPADFAYLNWRQRQLTKGNAPYIFSVACPKCGKRHRIEFDLSTLPVKEYDESEPLDLTYTTRSGDELTLTFITPRMTDECKTKARAFLEENKESKLPFETVRIRELVKMIIQTVNGKVYTDARANSYIEELYMEDITEIMNKASAVPFGLQSRQEFDCLDQDCGGKIIYYVPIS